MDWASPAVATRAARSRAAQVATAALRGAGLRLRVRDGSRGWVLDSPTGRSSVVGTLTGLWAEVSAWCGGVPPLAAPRPSATAPAAPAAPAAPGGPPEGPPVPSRRVAVLAGAAPVPGVEGWADRVVDASASVGTGVLVDALDGVLQGSGASRVLVVCPDPATARRALTAAGDPHLRQRCTVTALVRSADGPPWLDDVRALAPSAVPDLLDGAVPQPLDVTFPAVADLPAVACWMASVVASGASAGVRLRATVGPPGPRVLLDAADGAGVAVRPLPA